MASTELDRDQKPKTPRRTSSGVGASRTASPTPSSSSASPSPSTRSFTSTTSWAAGPPPPCSPTRELGRSQGFSKKLLRKRPSQGLMTDNDRDSILHGLDEIEKRIEAGEFVWRTDREDVRMNIEAALTDMIGEPVKKLHTARS
ncbi:putative argininosuccinate lyase, chloroplastic [Cocos nucifera]|uniref:Putative argininosuccinate lyase, chloroplastic n=1 Tax=Cocos nucifera TaxID=13894 RepID=A0A8K0N0K3_COCNU|nr:putative argininosuccinate lyase, chloroplastic [Cocos nucifera]